MARVEHNLRRAAISATTSSETLKCERDERPMQEEDTCSDGMEVV
jgi:hypothetical protein